ncbi:hypothetical protein EW145_g3759 [Phellinidium pouzarii]|uniref:Uncharacterized protein n=1 Tax=Phellinidium pouzarii TaxID=167371 RepID=A0A4S4L7V4_9AGAM|nr:hypothetical protein EW145_g3759 [Phellinidium pouzarii]
MNTSSNFASTFAPYTPPPDDPSAVATTSSSQKVRPWFPAQTDSSYQSGALPTLGHTFGGSAAGPSITGFGNDAEAEGPMNQWETRFAMRVDVLAAFAYVLGPVSALICLVLETHNDFVRFHAYQSALVTTPLVLLRIFGALIHFPSFLNTLITIWIVVVQAFLA